MIYFGLCLPTLSVAISCSLIETRATAQNCFFFLPELRPFYSSPIFRTDRPRLRCQAALMCRPGFLVQVRFLR